LKFILTESGDLLMKPNFQVITIKELKQYILENREDKEAFQVYMERINNQPSSQLYDEADIEQFSELLRENQTAKLQE